MKKTSKTLQKITGLRRPRHPMLDFVKRALKENGLMAEYQARPAYQQNDYIGWINNAKLQGTKEKRLIQMLEELKKGGVYMKMPHQPSKKNKKGV
ncbi:MAG: YdeI/OmpD-associated family protein [Desulfobacteraceae bacterium]|nr:YdeI/OmpD-associated family protein [Desulfobacteraceae bacterium]